MEGLRIPSAISAAVFAIAFIVGMTPACLSAKDYSIQSWKTGHGLEMHGIACCIIGSDGTVWIGATGGLIRFDGIRFERVPFDLLQSFSGNRITALWEDGGRGIWCGYETGEVVAYDRQSGHVRLIPLKWKREAVRAIHGDPHGDLWLILDDHSLVRASDGWTTGPENLGGGLRFLETDSGKFLAERSGGVFEWQPGGAWKHVHEQYNYVDCAAPSPRGGLWLASPHWDTARRIRDDDTVLETRPIPRDHFNLKMLEAKSGSLIAASDGHGVFSIGPGSAAIEYGVGDGLTSLWMQQIAEDVNGNIVAVSSEGVSVLRISKAETIVGTEDLGGARLMGVAGGDNGALWIGTEGAGLFRYRDRTLLRFDLEAGLSNPNVWSILDAGSDSVWAGSWGGGLDFGQGGRFRPENGWDLPRRRVVTALLRGTDGSIWAGTNDGIGQKKDGKWTWTTQCGSEQLGNVRYLALGGGGRIWFATEGRAAGCVDGKTVRLLDPGARTGSQFVTALHDDGAGGVWIGTEGAGLFHWRGGRWTRITQEDGLPSDNVFHIDDDGRESLWFTSSAGVYAVRKQQLDEVIARARRMVSPLTITSEDGLPSNQCVGDAFNAAYLDPDGRYYVPTSGGLAVIDTRRVRSDDAVLHPSITRVTIDGRQIAPSDGRRVAAMPQTQSIRVEYTAPTLAHPELVEFSYRIDGFGASSWIQLGQGRNLLLQRMAPGLHGLEIRAWDPSSMKMGPPVRLEIDQLPTLTETLWFRGMVAAAGLAALVLLIWYSVRWPYVRAQRRFELETAVEKERRRIARDIHDDLGAHLAQVMLLSQSDSGPDDAGARAQLFARIHAKAKDITKALDELVWAVNPGHDTVEGFASYVARIAQQTISAAGVRCRLRIPETISPTSLGSGARHHLIMCMKEAIANAIKHSSCSQIEVRIEMDENWLHLTVSDDGCGFEIPAQDCGDAEASDHSGCLNMRARMRELNGRMNLASFPGKGTKVSFSCPLWSR
jgi:signal transduction histidine kinase/ligand-binding sensor domain-containing protein